MPDLSFLLEFLMTKAPWLAQALVWVGALRLIFKPLFSFLRSLVDATPSAKDNELLNQVEGSKVYSVVAYILDYLASIKLPQKK
jgi:hypothetical protein